ncbi:MAG TPA: hypothetical protein VJN92_12960 [Candidatus Acidoferrum sp.]|nr:hypothetical protein [Candidatus Acidoferrum sp.]
MHGTDAANSALGSARAGWLYQPDSWLEAFVIFNFACLTGDIVFAHGSNQFRNRAEYVPLFFSAIACALLFAASLLRLRFNWGGVWKRLGYFVGWASIVVGASGVIYHLDSHFFYERTLKSLTYTAPFAAPLAYMGLGCLTLMNRMISHHNREWNQWILFFAMGGFAGNFVLSLADHATNAFFRWTEWLPVLSSALAVGFLFTLLVSDTPPGFRRLCSSLLLLQVLVGTLGFGIHFWADLHGPAGRLIDNLLSGAPPFAPLLLPNLSLLAWLALRAESELPRG